MSDIKKKIIKDHGEVFISAASILAKELCIVSVSPKLDLGLSGGIPTGNWVIISGKEKLGKTVCALQIGRNAQAKGLKVVYGNVENRIGKKELMGIKGLDLSAEKFEVIGSSQGNILNAEKHLTIYEHLLKNEPNICLIIDSASALCSASEQDGEITASSRNSGPKLLANFTRKLNSIVPAQNSIVIIIQHLIANTSGYGPAMMEDGGHKIQYQSSVKIRGKGFSSWEVGGKQIGQIVKWDVVFSALGPPIQGIESYLRYGIGIDDTWEYIDIACDLGLIEKAGAWFNLKFLPEVKKVQGQQGVWSHLVTNPDDLELLKKQIKSYES
jgi:recombination protein RecA